MSSQISTVSGLAQVTVDLNAQGFVTLTGVETLTNKTLSGFTATGLGVYTGVTISGNWTQSGVIVGGTVSGATFSAGTLNGTTISGASTINNAAIGGVVPAAIVGTTVSGTGAFTAQGGTAIPAGGSTGVGFLFSATSNFGIFFGSGAPTLTAAKGSLYLRSNGTGVADRAYINTDSGVTWVAISTVG